MIWGVVGMLLGAVLTVFVLARWEHEDQHWRRVLGVRPPVAAVPDSPGLAELLAGGRDARDVAAELAALRELEAYARVVLTGGLVDGYVLQEAIDRLDTLRKRTAQNG